MGFVIRTLVTAASLAVADYLLDGIDFVPVNYGFSADVNHAIALLLAAFALGILNALVKPILVLVSLPITCLTLGLFILVLNGLMLVILSLFPFIGFQVHDLLAAIIGGIVVSVVSFVLNTVIPD